MGPMLMFLALPAPGLNAAPRLSVAAPVFEFGNRRTGELIQHTFELRNTGDSLLKISSIRASCGCTTPGKSSLKIRPGETLPLPVEIDLTGRIGTQTQYITLTTNDPETPVWSLKLTGESIADIEIAPRTLNLGLLDPQSPQSGTIALTSTTGEPFQVTRAIANKDRVQLDARADADETSASIRVTPRITGQEGRFTDVVIVDTSHPHVKQERVLVMWQISTGVTVAPSQVNLVIADRPQLLNRYLMVKGFPGMEPELEVLEVSWPGQDQVEILWEDTKRFGWRIHLKNFTPAQDMADSELRIRTNAKGFETLHVPVRVLR